MADKTIGALSGIESLDEDSLFVAEQNGEAVKVSGKQLTDFANVETAEQVESAAKSAEAAKSAAESAGAAILKAPIIQNGTWWVYNQEQSAYQDTGVSATGPTGPAGPTQSVNEQTPDENGNVTVDSTQIKQPDGTVIKTILDRAASGGALDQAIEQKAPAGFGFGGEATQVVTAASASESHDTFCAKLDAVLETMPDKSVKMITAYPPQIWGLGSNVCILYKRDSNYAGLYSVSSYNIASTGFRLIKAKKTDDSPTPTWYPFEWVNPPMQLGVEYRTTERYLGKPVYVKLVDLGAGPAANTAKNVDHGITNMAHIVDFAAEMTVDGKLPLTLPYHANDNFQGLAYVEYNKFHIEAKNESLTGYTNCYGWVKYTKTTD